MGSAADKSPDIGAIRHCFRSGRSEGEWGRKLGQNFALVDPSEKYIASSNFVAGDKTMHLNNKANPVNKNTVRTL